MPPLENPRWERFTQALFEGETADSAYAKAGYKPNDGNCIRLKGNERVKARLVELQTEAAKKSEVTVQSLLDELEHARSRADGLDQLSAAVKAISEKARISGLLVQRMEVGGPGDFDSCTTIQEVADAYIHDLAPGIELTAAERDEFAGLMASWVSGMMEFLAAHTAKPTGPTVDPVAVERARLGLARRRTGNGYR